MMLEEVESAGQTQVSIAQVQPHNLSQCVSLGVCEWILCGRGLSVPDFAIGSALKPLRCATVFVFISPNLLWFCSAMRSKR